MFPLKTIMNVNISSELPEAPYFLDLAYRMSDYKDFILGLCSDSINKDSQSSSSNKTKVYIEI